MPKQVYHCLTCGKGFLAYPCQEKFYCGISCGHHANRKHGDFVGNGRGSTPEWRAWQGMRKRCYDPSYQNFIRYGGRGIVVCQRWLDSYADFLSDVGRKPGPRYTLDRYPNNDGNYEPGNVRWATPKEQCQNRRSTRFITHNGVTLCMSDWAARLGIPAATLSWRIYHGVPIEQALQPKRFHPHGLMNEMKCSNMDLTSHIHQD